ERAGDEFQNLITKQNAKTHARSRCAGFPNCLVFPLTAAMAPRLKFPDEYYRNSPLVPSRPCRTSTRVPGFVSSTVTLASSCLDKASTIPVPRPGLPRLLHVGLPL